ncbi:MAG TPA: M20/M25/M40 family metallo-hydrolase [Candidatus Dormibacteraeota bacterium]
MIEIETKNKVDAYIDENIDRWLDELARLCAIPSVSARHEGIDECAALVQELLRARGFDAEISPTAGHPVVVARAEGADPSHTLLFYNHYDVQPPEPLELWETPPFELSRRNGSVYARGAKDDKGEFIARLAAVDTVKAITGSYPCNLLWLAEGEEESGSVNLPRWVAENRERLRCDAAVWEEGGIESDGSPIIRLGARGLLYVELRVKTISRDAHSGGANLLPNAAWRLIWAISSLKDPDGRIQVDGFYDAVRPPTAREDQLLAEFPDRAAEYREEFGLERLLTEPSPIDRAFFEPTCNVAGFGSGYQGEGTKTVIPSEAVAKIDFRLVPNQDPADILRKLRKHLDSHGFEDVEVIELAGEPPGITDPDAPVVKLTAEIAEEVYGRPPQITPLGGGTTPMFLFTQAGVPVIAPGVGFGAANRAHSPNEFMRIEDFRRAVQHLARLVLRFPET